MLKINSLDSWPLKTYIKKTNVKVDQNFIKKWQFGINLQGKRTHLSNIEILKDNPKICIIKVISKGRINRQIRRFENSLGLQVN